MGHKQTTAHRFGKNSYHQIGLVRGQFGNVPMDKWVSFIQNTGFDGWEEASWELELNRCVSEAGAEAYAKERVRAGEETQAGDFHGRRSPSGPSPWRRTQCQNPAIHWGRTRGCL